MEGYIITVTKVFSPCFCMQRKFDTDSLDNGFYCSFTPINTAYTSRIFKSFWPVASLCDCARHGGYWHSRRHTLVQQSMRLARAPPVQQHMSARRSHATMYSILQHYAVITDLRASPNTAPDSPAASLCRRRRPKTGSVPTEWCRLYARFTTGTFSSVCRTSTESKRCV